MLTYYTSRFIEQVVIKLIIVEGVDFWASKREIGIASNGHSDRGAASHLV